MPTMLIRSISSFCWVFARYIFHALVLVVYHQYLYRVNTRESDRQELDRPGRILLVLVAHQYMYTLSVVRPPKRSTSHLPPGEETPNVWTSGRQKGKPLVRIQLVYKHRQPPLTFLKMKQRKPTCQ
jgi:hypothetical protein